MNTEFDVAPGYTNVALPGGHIANGGDTVVLTPAEVAALRPGVVRDTDDESETYAPKGYLLPIGDSVDPASSASNKSFPGSLPIYVDPADEDSLPDCLIFETEEPA